MRHQLSLAQEAQSLKGDPRLRTVSFELDRSTEEPI